MILMRQKPKKQASDGDPGRIRTCDLRIRSPLLYPAELRGHYGGLVGVKVLPNHTLNRTLIFLSLS